MIWKYIDPTSHLRKKNQFLYDLVDKLQVQRFYISNTLARISQLSLARLKRIYQGIGEIKGKMC